VVPEYPGAVLDSIDWDLVRKIKELHPWFHPVVLGKLRVTPGVGSHVAPEFLEHRTACRSSLLVDEVTRRFDVRGKSVLELACNCGYWSARYAERGAERVVGIEGREQYVRQAQLYFETNRFLAPDRFTFLHGNIAESAEWTRLRGLGPFDLTLCAGILYHVPNYRDILGWAAENTREVLIVDTRVEDGQEVPVEEPGELHSDAISQTRVKVVPSRMKLLERLRELGFDPEVLPVRFATGLGVDDVDDYASGRRIAVFARRVTVDSRVRVARAFDDSTSAS